MIVHGNRRLSDLAACNSQRTAFRRFLAVASDEVRSILQSAKTYYHPETPQEIISAVSEAIRAHDHSLSDCESAVARVTRTPTEAHSWVQNAVLHMSAELPMLMHFGGSSTVTFSGDALWIPKFPVVELSKRSTLAVLELALGSSTDSFCVATKESFVVLDSYEDSTPGGPTYEFTESSSGV